MALWQQELRTRQMRIDARTDARDLDSKEVDARDAVISTHEAAHAVACIRLGLRFRYVTMGDERGGQALVRVVDHRPRPIPRFVSGSCCAAAPVTCASCCRGITRAEACLVVAICGSVGVQTTGCLTFGYGHEADKAYAIAVCRTAFNDVTPVAIDGRLKVMLGRALDLVHRDLANITAVGSALQARRILSEVDVRFAMRAA